MCPAAEDLYIGKERYIMKYSLNDRASCAARLGGNRLRRGVALTACWRSIAEHCGGCAKLRSCRNALNDSNDPRPSERSEIFRNA